MVEQACNSITPIQKGRMRDSSQEALQTSLYSGQPRTPLLQGLTSVVLGSSHFSTERCWEVLF